MTEETRETNRDEEDASFLDLLIVLAQQKRLVFGLPAAVSAIATVIAFLVPTWYAGTAKILPPQQSQSNAVAILGQIGVLAGSASQALGLKNPSDVYVSILRSRSVADKLIERFNLRQIYDEDLLHDLRKELARNSNITAGREGIITIEVEDRDAKRAAQLANAYVEELRALTINLAISEASQRRVFFEAQLQKSKTELTNAEIELKRFTTQAGLVNPQGQISLSVAAAAALRAQIAAKEIQMSAMRSFATEVNPEMKRVLQEISGLRAELQKMEAESNPAKGDVLVPFGKAPELGLEYVRRYRDMKYQETLFEVLAKQYEIARIDEAKDATLIQVLDSAVPADRRAKPNRTLIVILSVLASALVAVAVAFLRYALRDPNSRFSRSIEQLTKLLFVEKIAVRLRQFMAAR